MQRLWRTFKKNKKLNAQIAISTPNGKLIIVRNMDYCIKCGKFYGQNDELLGINKEHRITKDFLEVVTYTAQMISGFKKAEELLLKLKGIEISATQIKILSEEVGKKLSLIHISEPTRRTPI